MTADASPILVLGSKPDPVFPERVSEVVFVNGSVTWSEEVVARYGAIPRRHLLSDFVLTDAKPECGAARRELEGRRVDELVVVETAPAALHRVPLEALDYRAERVRTMSRHQRDRLLLDRVGRWALAGRYLTLPLPIRSRMRHLRNLLRGSVEGEGKPSTGIVALLWMLDDAGRLGGREVVLAGIGAGPPGHAYGSGTRERGHTAMDIWLLQRLVADGVRLGVTDEELRRVLAPDKRVRS